MNDSRFPALFFLLLLALAMLQWVHAYPQLPDRMASHFSANGTPNGWQPKQAFFLVMPLVVVLCAVMSFLVPRVIALMPSDKINLPNKDYWLAPERRDETWRFFGAQMAWFGCALLFLLLSAASLAINANLPSIGQFDSQRMWYVLAGFVIFVVIWMIHFVRHFFNVPNSHATSAQNSWKK